jgi:hypothetical protein
MRTRMNSGRRSDDLRRVSESRGLDLLLAREERREPVSRQEEGGEVEEMDERESRGGELGQVSRTSSCMGPLTCVPPSSSCVSFRLSTAVSHQPDRILAKTSANWTLPEAIVVWQLHIGRNCGQLALEFESAEKLFTSEAPTSPISVEATSSTIAPIVIASGYPQKSLQVTVPLKQMNRLNVTRTIPRSFSILLGIVVTIRIHDTVHFTDGGGFD